MKILRALVVFSVLLTTACQSTIPKDALVLTKESLATRQLQTRKYDTKDEAKVLSAVAGVLQDMGFTLNESQMALGVISASKTRSAVDAGQQVVAIALALLGGGVTATDEQQVMQASVTTAPVGGRMDQIAVRVTFQRIVYNTNGQVSKAESLQDKEMYQGFFEKLSKSIFLEAQEI